MLLGNVMTCWMMMRWMIKILFFDSFDNRCIRLMCQAKVNLMMQYGKEGTD